jgi:hypothetical protein
VLLLLSDTTSAAAAASATLLTVGLWLTAPAASPRTCLAARPLPSCPTQHLLLLLLLPWSNCRTVADGTCRFPQNMFGCETAAAKYTGGVKFIADDYALECEVRQRLCLVCCLVLFCEAVARVYGLGQGGERKGCVCAAKWLQGHC